jgi:TolB-like protein
MSPEQARGQLVDARTDLFSLGTVLYQLAGGMLPCKGDTAAVVFDAILNRDPKPIEETNPAVPPEFGRILSKLLEKDRTLRCQTASELKTDLNRLKRNLESGSKRAAEVSDSKAGTSKLNIKSVAVLYFENLSGAKEDEYLRDGITEDIITELSKIRGLNTYSRPTVLAFRDKQVTPSQIGQQLNAAYVLTGSLRRSGSRLRITTQLVDAQTDFPLWSERYDRERNSQEDCRGVAGDPVATRTGSAGCETHGEFASLRFISTWETLRAGANPPGPGICAADV